MPLSVVGAGGGSSPNPPGKELGYTQITTNFAVGTTHSPTRVTALNTIVTVPTGVKHVVEFFCAGLDEDSGSTANELVTASIDMDNSVSLTTGNVYQITGGLGNALYMRSPTLVGDGSAHTYGVLVENVTTATDGVIIEASGDFPCFLRVISA